MLLGNGGKQSKIGRQREKVKKENPEQLKESKEYKLKNLKDFTKKS